MTKDTFTVLAAYNKGANENMDGVIKALGAEDWDKPLGGFFKSIRELCSHLYVADFFSLKRFKELREFKTLRDPFFDANFDFMQVLFPAKDEYLAKRPELDGKIAAFVEELDDGDIQKIMKLTTPRGNMEQNMGGLLLSSFIHQTHHRGQISMYLDQLGKDNDFSSLNPFV